MPRRGWTPSLSQASSLAAASKRVSPLAAVTNQLKILPTAFFSALYLGRRLSRQQWASLPGLALGVAIVNSSTGQMDSHGAARFGREWAVGLAGAFLCARPATPSDCARSQPRLQRLC